MKNWVSKEVERFQKAISALESEFTARKQALFAELAELMGVPAAPVKGKPGRPPKSAFGAVVAPKRRGRKPGRPPLGPRPGRKPAGEDTLPTIIIKVLTAADQPLNAKEILGHLEQKGWRTSSGDPQSMVYKTLHRIEKSKMVVKAGRGKFAIPK